MREMKEFDQIEDYLKDRLSPAEHQAFEAQMAADPELAGAVDLHRDMMLAIHQVEEEQVKKNPAQDVLDLREMMENAYQEYLTAKPGDNTPPDKPVRRLRWGPYVFGSLALLLLIGLIWSLRHDQVKPVVKDEPGKIDTLQPIAQLPPAPDTPQIKSKIASQENGQDYATIVRKIYEGTAYAPGVLMGDDAEDPAKNPITAATKAYTQHEFAQVLQLLKNLPEEGRGEALKLRAHAAFRLNRFERAASDFEELRKSALQKKDAEWYLLLCYAARLPKTQKDYEALLPKVAANGANYEQRVQDLKKVVNLKK